jgi:hypothetical protein
LLLPAILRLLSERKTLTAERPTIPLADRASRAA